MSVQVRPLKIYNASAGSGKTYTLVQSYLKIVLHHKDPMRFRSILAMTFTNKAANEMKERIVSALIDLSTDIEFKTDGQLRFLQDTAANLKLPERLVEHRAIEVLNKILHNYSSFSVMTIDKFTHKVIRTFARDLGIAIDFNVEMDIKGFRKNVTDMLVDQIGRNKKLTNLMLQYAHDNLKDDKSWNFTDQIFQFSDLLFKEDAIQAIQQLKDLSDEDFVNIKTELIQNNAKIEQAIKRNATELFDLVQSKGLTADDFTGKSRGVYGYIKKYANGDYKLPSATVSNNVADQKWANPKSPNAGTVESISDLLSQYFNQITDLIETAWPTVKLNLSILKNLNNLSLLKYLLVLIDQVKADENILLLSDFYKEIAAIITNEPVPFIYERLGVRYQHFLLDEFQDTSQLQWVNLIPLVHNALAQQQDNLIVGDGKQAIYRWRNGEVEQFTKLPHAIHNPGNIASLKEAEKLFDQMGERVSLNANYRSSETIVNFNNAFFGHLAHKLDEELRYIYNDHAQVPTKHFEGYVEGYFGPDLDMEDQLNFVLKSVQRALDAGFNQKDICIITRVNRSGAAIASYLTAHQYKVISPESLFIGKDRTVKFVNALMTAIAIVSDRNAKIKCIEHYCGLKNLPVSTFLIDNAQKYTHQSIIAFFETLGVSVLPADHFHNLYDFVEHIIEVFELDPTENPYLQFYLEHTHQFETNKSANLRDFLYWFKEKGRTLSIISPEGADAINIMTIHKSKGLQFPIVICPFFDWRLDLHKQISWVNRPEEQLPAYFVNMTSDLAESELAPIYNTERAKYTLDQYNLLYVAFTRPEIALFISGNTRTGIAKSDILPAVLANDQFQVKDQTVYQLGQLTYPTGRSASALPNNIAIKYIRQKMNKPELSYKSAMEWDIDELDQKRNFGTLIHQILAQLPDPSQLRTYILDIAEKKGLSDEDSHEIYTYISPLLQSPRFAAYFTGKSLNEKAIVDAKGRKFIPDRIIVQLQGLLVVDFKTGQPSPSHQKQVADYIRILKDMGHEQVSGEICYTNPLSFVPVV